MSSDRRPDPGTRRPHGAAPDRAVEGGDGRVDLATAQRLVDAAVADATARERKGQQIAAERVAAAIGRGSRRVTVLGVGVVIALGAVIVAGFYVDRSRRAAQALALEAGVGLAQAATPSGAAPTQVLNGRAIYAQSKGALYVMGYLTKDRIGGCCTAFAIGPDLLATNAHCVRACKERGGTPIVIQNEAAGTRFKILAMSSHPAYSAISKSADTPDVGLLRVDGRLPVVATLANDLELHGIGPGDDAFVLGFPGRVMDPREPSATFLGGRIGRVTGLKDEATTPDKAVLLQHDCVTRGGNSGSPIFNQHGHVIGIHAAHLEEEDERRIAGQQTKVVGSSPFRVGMRVDLLRGVPPP